MSVYFFGIDNFTFQMGNFGLLFRRWFGLLLDMGNFSLFSGMTKFQFTFLHLLFWHGKFQFTFSVSQNSSLLFRWKIQFIFLYVEFQFTFLVFWILIHFSTWEISVYFFVFQFSICSCILEENRNYQCFFCAAGAIFWCILEVNRNYQCFFLRRRRDFLVYFRSKPTFFSVIFFTRQSAVTLTWVSVYHALTPGTRPRSSSEIWKTRTS